jgi:RNA polymerase sigma factor (TIGR02999 family)
MVGPVERAGSEREWAGRQQFLAFAASAMRSVLVDHARRRKADKRGGNRGRVPLDVLLDARSDSGVDVVALGDALDKLMREDPDLARVVELRFFSGLTMEETASALGVSLSTAERHWRLARMWLREELGGSGAEVDG